jgi:hypothetical protein
MPHPISDPAFLATVLHAARFSRRRDACRLLHRAGLPSASADLDAVLALIDARPDRADIAAAAARIRADAEDASQVLLHGPRWIVGETTDGTRAEWIVHNRHPRFLARLVTAEEAEAEGLPLAMTDPGDGDLSGICPPIYLDSIAGMSPNQINGLLMAALREAEIYGQQFDDLADDEDEDD